LNKKNILLLVALLVLLAGVFAWKSGLVRMPGGERAAETISGPDISIPDVSSNEAFGFVNVSDTGTLSDSISLISGLISRFGENDIPPTLSDRFGGEDLKKTLAVLGSLKAFVDTSTQMAICATSSDKAEFYVSLFVDDEKFDSFVSSGDSSLYRFEDWSTDKSGSDGRAWMLKPAIGDGASSVLYVTKRRVGDTSVVNIALEEEGIDRMKAAADDAARRMSVTRSTKGPNFAQVKFKAPMDVEGWKISNAETSWNRDENSIHFQSFSDMYGAIASVMSRDYTPQATPIVGDGNVALFASFDPLFYCHALFPKEPDPVEYIFSNYGAAIPAEIAKDLKNILGRCRISVVVVAKDNEPNTAYVVLDSGAVESVGTLYGLAGMFLGSQNPVEGWDSIYNIPLPMSRAPISNAVLARRGGTVLLGLGYPADYTHTLEAPSDMESVVSTANVVSAFITSEFMSLKDGKAGKSFLEGMGSGWMKNAGVHEYFRDMMDLDNVSSLSLEQTLDGRGDMNIIWKSGGNN
jgi:hypothetical protein